MKTILLVDSNEEICKSVKDVLTLANYTVSIARNGKEAIEMTQILHPDLIISEICMPILDGFEMLHLLRHNPKTESIPVIFLTSLVDRENFRRAMESGADDFITKPFSNGELLKAVANRFDRLTVIKKNRVTDLKTLNEPSPVTLRPITPQNDLHIYRKSNVFCQEMPIKHYLYFMFNDSIRAYKTYEDGKQLVIGLYVIVKT